MKNTSVQVITDLMAHIRQIQRKLVYKHAEIKQIHIENEQERIWILLSEFQQNGKKIRLALLNILFNSVY